MKKQLNESTIVVIIMVSIVVLAAALLLSSSAPVLNQFKRQFMEIFSSVFFWVVVGLIALMTLVVAGTNYLKKEKQNALWRTRKGRVHTIDLAADISDPEIRQHFSRWLSTDEIQAYVSRLTRCEPIDIMKLVDFILVQAVGQRASDIHIEPLEDRISVKFRIDGVIHEIAEFEKFLHSRLVSRMRVMSNLAIYERNVPQDGRLNTTIMGSTYEVRISIMPTLHGEKTVIRLFEVGDLEFDLAQLGMQGQTLTTFNQIISAPQGIVFLTGPTGSGKTTTIYSALKEIYTHHNGTVNIVTIEDPIEHDMKQFNQTQVNTARGLTFASGLRSMLRQDPNVIMVGEIRDLETAEIAIRAGFTGHLVLSTIHADSAAGVFNRLIEMKIEPFLLSSATSAIISQRLVRKLCPHCRQETIPELSLMERIGVKFDQPIHYFTSPGCHHCMNRGFIGRTGVFELMVVNDDIRDLVVKKTTTHEIHRAARANGMVTLVEDGLTKVNQGLTSLEEMFRVIA